MIKIGTSGYSYDDWRDHFYPNKLPANRFLSYYARPFSTVEINSTYYRIPEPRMFTAMLNHVPDTFQFVVKVSQEFTHRRDRFPQAVKPFRLGIEPLIAAGQLGCLLAQFPYSFKRNAENQIHLERVRDVLRNLPINVEFRHSSWVTDETFAFLKAHQLGYICVDMPQLPGLLPPSAVATTEIGYIRFHGRNTEHWWSPPKSYMRYDYLYTEAELKEWLPRIRTLERQTETVYAFMNNHWHGKSAVNARMLGDLLGQPISSGSQRSLFEA